MMPHSPSRPARWRPAIERIAILSSLIASLGACACPPHSPAAVRRQLVAAWDFNDTGAGPLADKATGGQHADDLTAQTAPELMNGVALLGTDPGSGLFAQTSRDLDLQGPLTIWMRVRILEVPAEPLSLIKKAGEDAGSYELDISPAGDDGTHFGLGGAVTYADNAGGRLATGAEGELLPVGVWREVALVVRQERSGFVARWYASRRPHAERAEDWKLVNGPLALPARRRILPVDAPLVVGAGTLGTSVAFELDEMHVYARGLTLRELAQVETDRLDLDEHHDHDEHAPGADDEETPRNRRDLVTDGSAESPPTPNRART